MIFYRSNTEEAFKELNTGLIMLSDSDKILKRAVFNNLAQIKRRIQNKGNSSSGKKIGNYKGTQNKTKSGKLTGWARIRQEEGRQTKYIDLTFSGDLMRTYVVLPIDENTLALGWTNEKEYKIAGYLENRYGDIFGLSKKELREFVEDVNKEIDRIINRE